MKNLVIGFLLSIPICIMCVNAWDKPVQANGKHFVSYVTNNEEKALGVDYGQERPEYEPTPLHIEATAYCLHGTMANGDQVRQGVCAIARKYIGMTAIVYTEDYELIGIYEVCDTGADERIVSGDCIDIWNESEDWCKEFGRKNVIVYLVDAKG